MTRGQKPGPGGRYVLQQHDVGGRPIPGVWALHWIPEGRSVPTLSTLVTTVAEERLPLLAALFAPFSAMRVHAPHDGEVVPIGRGGQAGGDAG